MNALIGLGVLVAVAGCGGRDSDGPGARDDGGPARDAGPDVDGGPRPDGGGPGPDGGGVDAGIMPEDCAAAGDEDGDTRADCDDDDCWSVPSCAADHVARSTPGLVPCGDAIERTTEETAAACTTIGTPMGSMTPTDCASGASLEATARIFCDAGGVAAAMWIDERLRTPTSQRMLSPRTFEHIYDERQSVLDWERRTSGASSTEGGITMPLFEWHTSGGDTDLQRVITVRPVEPGTSISRLLGLARITSFIDLDAPMSMDTRRNYRAGAATFAVPR